MRPDSYIITQEWRLHATSFDNKSQLTIIKEKAFKAQQMYRKPTVILSYKEIQLLYR